VVLHTGDFLTHREGDFDTPLYEALATIRAPYGQWACLGNHDYDDPARIARRLDHAGVTLLRDQLRTIDVAGRAVEIAGTNFVFSRTQHEEIFARLFAALLPRDEAARILLNHDPRNFFSLPDGAADLVLALLRGEPGPPPAEVQVSLVVRGSTGPAPRRPARARPSN
ncbi:MAG TPA: hypothetical protein PL196_06700, partial [Burkholderiaceae bacterium]|nr:hypothetical protein [Burkholderiaceae bacterium]